MKEKKIKYSCDWCSKTEEFKEEIKETELFNLGWLKVNNIDMNFIDENSLEISDLRTKDKDFCSKDCFRNYISDILGMKIYNEEEVKGENFENNQEKFDIGGFYTETETESKKEDLTKEDIRLNNLENIYKLNGVHEEEIKYTLDKTIARYILEDFGNLRKESVDGFFIEHPKIKEFIDIKNKEYNKNKPKKEEPKKEIPKKEEPKKEIPKEQNQSLDWLKSSAIYRENESKPKNKDEEERKGFFSKLIKGRKKK